MKILVTGIGGPAGRSLSQQLQERGFRVVGTDMAQIDPPGAQFARVPAARDEDFLETLAHVVAEYDVDLLIPTVTEELVVIAQAIEERGPYGVFGRRVAVVVGTHRAVAIADDKMATALFLTEAGVPSPVTYGGQTLTELGDAALAALGTPWLSKPRSGRGGRGVEVHDAPATQADVRTALRDRLIMQSFASGIEYAPNLYVARDPGQDVAVVLHKTELAHGIHGNAVSVERVADAEHIGELGLRAARAIGLYGPVDVDIRLTEDGTPVVLEINARFGANSAHAPEILDALLAEYAPSVAAMEEDGRVGCASALVR